METSAPTQTVPSEEEKKKWKTCSTPQDCSLVPTLAVTLFLGWNGAIIFLILYLSFFASSTQRIVCIGLCTLNLILPRDFPRSLGLKVGKWIVTESEKYFGLKTTLEDEEAIKEYDRQGKAIIFAFEPHDILPYNLFAVNSSLKRLPGRVGETQCGLMTGAIFKIPFLRTIYTWVAAQPIDKSTFRRMLKNKESLSFVPGGVQEVINMDPGAPENLVLYLKNRKGFIKLALETGSPIAPVFCFNLDGSYGSWVPRGKLMAQIARKIGFLPLFFWGRFGIPFGIPRPQKLHVVFGKPMDIPCEGDDIQVDSVDKYHAMFLQELEALFERHKVAEGYGDRTLKII